MIACIFGYYYLVRFKRSLLLSVHYMRRYWARKMLQLSMQIPCEQPYLRGLLPVDNPGRWWVSPAQQAERLEAVCGSPAYRIQP